MSWSAFSPMLQILLAGYHADMDATTLNSTSNNANGADDLYCEFPSESIERW